MPRFFIEVAYKGTNYSGFQIQENAATIQSEIEKVIELIQKQPTPLTGSSRTDTGVHALQNFFHFDSPQLHPQFLYKLNAILPRDIVVKNAWEMPPDAHSRFDATSRAYLYNVSRIKDPFSQETSFYYPFKLDLLKMQDAAAFIKTQQNFRSFSKTNTQVNNFRCSIKKSEWTFSDDSLSYAIEANRFLRGMVRLLTGAMLKIGRGKMTMDELKEKFENVNYDKAYAAPAHGLFLQQVNYPDKYFNTPIPEHLKR